MSPHTVERLVTYVAHYIVARSVWQEIRQGVEGASVGVYTIVAACLVLVAIGWRRRRRRDRYRAALKSRHWRRLRVSAYRRSCGRCEGCRKRAFLSVLQLHHLTYEHVGKERLKEVRLLCDACHRRQHGIAA
jgi:hypothetical protein